MVGLTESTLSRWINNDEALAMKIQSWENAINRIAMSNIRQQISAEADEADKRKEMTKWWSERKMKADFSTRVENINDTKLTVEELPPERIEQIKNALRD